MTKRGLTGVNEALFLQLERLDAVDASDPEAMRSEIARAKAVEGLAGRIIENGRLVLDVARSGTDVGEKVNVPKGLLGL